MILGSGKIRAPRRAIRRGRQGFTLIELLVVMGILALLVAIALPRYTGARLRAHRAEIQSDLRNLVSAEESYFDMHYTYTSTLADLDYNTSANVTIQFVDVSASGWSARGTHANTTAQCGIYVGNATVPSGIPITAEGIIGCTEVN